MRAINSGLEFEDYMAKLKRELLREAYKNEVDLLDGFQMVCETFVLDAVV